MKVLLDGTAIANYSTGVGIYTYKLVKKLCEIDSDTEFYLLIPETLKLSHTILKINYSNLEFIRVQIPPIGIKRDFIFNIKLVPDLKNVVYHCLSTNYPLTFNLIPKGIVEYAAKNEKYIVLS